MNAVILICLALLQPPWAHEDRYTDAIAARWNALLGEPGQPYCRTDVVMPDGTRCDIVTDTHACEVEWAHKWKEAPGQAGLYSILAKKKPCIVLLLRDRNEEKHHLLRCILVCREFGIHLIVFNAKDIEVDND